MNGTEFLPRILAQHIFTSFIWTVSEKITKSFLRNDPRDVDIINPYKFDPRDFEKTWSLPLLRHRELTSLVSRMETYGLGSQTDLLLCMIPAFSSEDLLPNHRILDLIPRIDPGRGWVEMAQCYRDLLTIHTENQVEDRFSFSVAVAAMDFLYVAFEPYSKAYHSDAQNDFHDSSTNRDELSGDLRTELFEIFMQLTSNKFGGVLKRLVPFYKIQGRSLDFLDIFKYFKSDVQATANAELSTNIIDQFQQTKTSMDSDFIEQHGKRLLNFSEAHKAILNGKTRRIKPLHDEGEWRLTNPNSNGYSDCY